MKEYPKEKHQLFSYPMYRCHYLEHSYTNPVNQLINATFQKFRATALLKDVTNIRRAFETASQGKKLPLRALQEVQQVKNPYFHPYNEVIGMSRKLLRDEFADFHSASDTNALFFDVSMLFEYFVRKLVSRAGVYVHQKNEAVKFEIPSGGRYKKGLRALYPDLVFDDESGNTHVFDVKYKRYDFTYGVKREDLFQIHTYLGQVANKHNVVRCGLIYPIYADHEKCPENGVIQDHFKYQGRGVIFEIHFFKVPAPSCSDYKKTFISAKDEFIQQLIET